MFCTFSYGVAFPCPRWSIKPWFADSKVPEFSPIGGVTGMLGLLGSERPACIDSTFNRFRIMEGVGLTLQALRIERWFIGFNSEYFSCTSDWPLRRNSYHFRRKIRMSIGCGANSPAKIQFEGELQIGCKGGARLWRRHDTPLLSLSSKQILLVILHFLWLSIRKDFKLAQTASK